MVHSLRRSRNSQGGHQYKSAQNNTFHMCSFWKKRSASLTLKTGINLDPIQKTDS